MSLWTWLQSIPAVTPETRAEATGILDELLPGVASRARSIAAGATRRRQDVSQMSKYGPYASGYQFDPGQVDPFSGGDADVAYRQSQYPHHHRRQNPLNIRAARRAISRIKSVMKILHRIESHLPRPRVRRGLPLHHTRYPFHRRRR